MLISSTAQALVQQYTDRLALDWRRRQRLLESPLASYADLMAWDERMQCCMAALHLLGDTAHNELLSRLDDPLTPGEVFVIAWHAFDSQNDALAQACCALAQTLPHLQTALLAAIEWSANSVCLQSAIGNLPWALQFQAMAGRSRFVDPAADRILYLLRTRALPASAHIAAFDALRELGHIDGAAEAAVHLVSHDAALRLAATQLVMALAPGDVARDALAQLTESDDEAIAFRAARSLAVHTAWPVTFDQSSPPQRIRLGLQSLGWVGYIEWVPTLIEYLDEPTHARVAAVALSTITGSDPVADGWQADAPLASVAMNVSDLDSPSIPLFDVDSGLPWPCAARFSAWWERSRAAFDDTQRHLGGRIIDRASLGQCLQHGRLDWRGLAALHLQRLDSGPLFPTRRPASVQSPLIPLFFQEPTVDAR